MTNEQLKIIHNSLSAILVLLRDNPEDETNPQLFRVVQQIIHTAEDSLTDDI